MTHRERLEGEVKVCKGCMRLVLTGGVERWVKCSAHMLEWTGLQKVDALDEVVMGEVPLMIRQWPLVEMMQLGEGAWR